MSEPVPDEFFGITKVIRGNYSEPATLVIDARIPGWKGWRVHMVEVDEKHRTEYMKIVAEKEKAGAPVPTCSISAPDDDDCIS